MWYQVPAQSLAVSVDGCLDNFAFSGLCSIQSWFLQDGLLTLQMFHFVSTRFTHAMSTRCVLMFSGTAL